MEEEKKIISINDIINNKPKSRKKVRENSLPILYDVNTKEKKILNTKKNTFSKDFFKIKKNKLFFIIIIFFLLATGIYFYINRQYDNISVLWKKNWTTNNNISFSSPKYDTLKSGIIRWTNDGITYKDYDGNLKWTKVYNIKNPGYVKEGEYFSIYSIGENNIYIFNEAGLVGEVETSYQIEKLDISETGTVYVLLDSKDSSLINVYDRTGNIIDISIKTIFKENGMPLDLSISNDGAELMLSFAYIEDISLKTRVVFYNFSEIGKNFQNNIVAGFDNEYKDKFVARVHFFDNEKAICAYDGGITFFSTKILTEPEIIKNITFEDNIKTISYTDKNISLILEKEKNDEEKGYYFLIYDTNGNLKARKDFDFYYDNFEMTENFLVFTYQNHLIIYDIKGKKRYDNEYKDNIFSLKKVKVFSFFDEAIIFTDTYSEYVRFY